MAFGKWSNKNRLESYNDMLARADQLDAEGKSEKAARIRARAEKKYAGSQERASDRASGQGAGAWWDRLTSNALGFGTTAPGNGEPPGFDALDELEKSIAQYSYSASRGAYSPFFSKAGKRGSGERAPARRDPWSGSAPTPGDNRNHAYGVTSPGAHRGLAQALGASLRSKRNAKPGSLAPRIS